MQRSVLQPLPLLLAFADSRNLGQHPNGFRIYSDRARFPSRQSVIASHPDHVNVISTRIARE